MLEKPRSLPGADKLLKGFRKAINQPDQDFVSTS